VVLLSISKEYVVPAALWSTMISSAPLEPFWSKMLLVTVAVPPPDEIGSRLTQWVQWARSDLLRLHRSVYRPKSP
jgi:hypothetical protein